MFAPASRRLCDDSVSRPKTPGISTANESTMASRQDLLSEEEVLRVLKEDFAKEECQLVGYGIVPASEHPIGFLGDHSRLEVKLRGERHSKRVYFVKHLPEGNASRRDYLKRLRCFHKEIGLYKNVFVTLEKAAPKIPKWRPKYLYSREDDLIVLEDLTLAGYYMYPEREVLGEEHVLRSLETLAAMHASSIVFEEKFGDGARTTLWDEFSPYLFETTASADKNHPGNAPLEAAITAQLKIVDLLPGYSSKQKEEIKRELPARMRRLCFLVKPSRKFRNVIVHGDLWSNNFLFSKDKDGKVKSAKIVDFQLARYAPPAHDIVTFLSLVQTRKYRQENHLRLLRHYYDALSVCLTEHGLRPSEVLTWYELLGTYDYYEELGVLTAVFFFQLILTPPELCKNFIDSPEAFLRLILVDRSDLVTESFRKDSVYRERVTEIMKELIDEYIL